MHAAHSSFLLLYGRQRSTATSQGEETCQPLGPDICYILGLDHQTGTAHHWSCTDSTVERNGSLSIAGVDYGDTSEHTIWMKTRTHFLCVRQWRRHRVVCDVQAVHVCHGWVSRHGVCKAAFASCNAPRHGAQHTDVICTVC